MAAVDPSLFLVAECSVDAPACKHFEGLARRCHAVLLLKYTSKPLVYFAKIILKQSLPGIRLYWNTHHFPCLQKHLQLDRNTTYPQKKTLSDLLLDAALLNPVHYLYTTWRMRLEGSSSAIIRSRRFVLPPSMSAQPFRMNTQYGVRSGRGSGSAAGTPQQKSKLCPSLDLLSALQYAFASAVRYAANLHLNHDIPLTRAYSSAVAQFRSLRSEQQLARQFARLEAEWYGVEFGPSQVEKTFQKEEKVMDSWANAHEITAGENAARKRWKAVVERDGLPGSWTKGQEYVRLWQEGIRPTYAPLLAPERKITPDGVVAHNPNDPRLLAKREDYMKVFHFL